MVQVAAGPGAGAGAEPSRSGRRRPARRAATMSVFGKLFGAGGGKSGKGGPTPQEAIQRLRDTEEMLSKKQEFLEKKIEQELTAAKKHGTKNKRGESARPLSNPDSTLVELAPGSARISEIFPVRFPSVPFWVGDSPRLTPFSVSPSLQTRIPSPPPSGSPHSARPLQTLFSQHFPLPLLCSFLFRLFLLPMICPRSPSHILPPPPS